MALEPAGHRVMLKQDDINTKTDWGFEVVTNEKLERAAVDTGIVVAIGPNAWKLVPDETPWAKVGDKVYFARHAGKVLEDLATKEKFLIINDEDVLCVIKND